MTLALGTRLVSTGGGNIVPPDEPILRRVLVTDQTEEPLVLEFDIGNPVIYIVASEGTFDSVVVEDGTTFLVQEDSGKLIIQPN